MTALQRGFTTFAASIIIGNKVRDVETRAASDRAKMFVIEPASRNCFQKLVVAPS